jgi:phospholipase C
MMPDPTIDHVVVLMLENRSFDHMLGFLYPAADGFAGVSGRENDYYNLADPLDPTSPRYTVNSNALSKDLDRDSGHNFGDVHEQLFGVPLGAAGVAMPPTNGGFVANYARRNAGAGARIMNCFNPTTLPVLSRLAEEFAVCDHWYSSTPGPTWPNRLFAYTGSSDGRVDNAYRLYDDATVFNQLQDGGKTWAFYMDGHVTQAMALKSLWSWKRWAFRRLDTFKTLAASGDLPNYAFLEPRFFRADGFKAPTDQHPPHDVHRGEQLIADVYKAVRRGPAWERTLLIITYDEHGGTYDHVHPPRAVPPGPLSENPPFAFDRYGARVPAVVVSPFIERNTVVNTVFDHTSLIATVRHVFGIAGSLTPRDAAAVPASSCLNRTTPRTDAPTDVRDVIPAPQKVGALTAMIDAESSPGPASDLNDYQEQLLAMTRDLTRRPAGEITVAAAKAGLPIAMTEDIASREIEENVLEFINS